MKKSRLLAEMHETARGLHRAGALRKKTLRDFDALCLPPVRAQTAKHASESGPLPRSRTGPKTSCRPS